MQEAEWFYLEDTSAEITTTDQQMATDQVMKKVSEVVKQHRTRACGRFAVTRQHKEETTYTKPGWVLDRRECLMVWHDSIATRFLIEDELRRQSNEIVDEMNFERVCR